MFSNLFEGDLANENDYTGENSNLEQKQLVVERPPPERSKIGLIGLENLGATCYLNSLLQTMFFTPEFREPLLSLSHSELGTLSSSAGGEGVKARVIPLQLQLLFARMLLLDQQYTSTVDLTNSFGWVEEEVLQQHDVQELNRVLFNAIENSLIGTEGKDLISKLYHGTTVNQVECSRCKKTSERLEDYLDLTVLVSGQENLENSLNISYNTSEVLTENNQYFCNQCQRFVDAERRTKIRSLPKILTFALMRFSFDPTTGDRFKETGYFPFPYELDMKHYCDKLADPEMSVYQLYSVVIHSGSTHGGHYHVFIRDINQFGNWTPPSPGKTEDQNPISFNTSNPVELIASILLEDPSKTTNLNNLCARILKKIGSSWNNHFKANFGPIKKFLTKHNESFKFDEEKDTVKLSNSLKWSLKFQDKNDNVSYPIDHWFDFNDHKVTCITCDDVEKQFGGNESAYMLFYRKKSMDRTPALGENHNIFLVPDRLSETIFIENSFLHKKRQEYKEFLNLITVELRFSVNYHFINGALKPLPGKVDCIPMQIDQRWKITRLKREIFTKLPGLCGKGSFTIYLAKELPAGLHLFHQLPDDDVVLDLCKKDILFISHPNHFPDIPKGRESTPILLNVTCIIPSGDVNLIFGFPQNKTIAELKIQLTTISAISFPIELIVRDTCSHRINQSPKRTLEDEEVLAFYGLTDGDSLLAHNPNNERMIHLCVFNKCKENKNLRDSLCPKTSFLVASNSDLKLLKIQILDFLKINLRDHFKYRFRHATDENRKPKTPLYEDRLIESVLQDFNPSLVIEEGIPPQADEMTLFFGFGSYTPVTFDYDINVKKDITVEQCLRDMVKQAEWEGPWHLCKTNGFGEAIKELNRPQAALQEYQVVHGDRLMIQEGFLQPEGFITLRLRLYSTPEPIIYRECCKEELAQRIKNLFGRNQTEDIFGEVQLSSSSTLEDLKRQLMTLEPIPNLFLPNFKFLRLRISNEGRLGKIIRGHSETIKRLKLHDKQILCFQILSFEEDLNENELLLNIIERLPDEKISPPPSELIWDMGKRPYPKDLFEGLADILRVPSINLIIAKHLPEHYKWQFISSNSKSKSLLGKKPKLTSAPYFLKDGDTIAVKNNLWDQNDFDDFSTLEDLKGRKNLEASKFSENLPLIRVEEVKGGDSSPKQPRSLFDSQNNSPHRNIKPEVGIKICVDDFTR